MPDETETDDTVSTTTSHFQEVAGTSGREWDVILIEAGTSKNGNHYPAETLRDAAALFERAPAFADHATDAERQARPERSVRDKVGTFSQVAYGSHDVGGRVVEGLRARFKAIAPWVREVLKEAADAGESDFIGFSIDANGRVARREHNGRAVAWVEAISRVNSVDLVTDPAAGGRIVRLVASNHPVVESETTMTPDEIAKLIQDGIAAAMAAQAPAPTAVAEPAAETAAETPPVPVAEAAAPDLTPMRLLLVEAKAVTALAATKLSEQGKQFVIDGLKAAAQRGDVTDTAIREAVTKQVEYEGILTEARPVALPGARLSVGDAEHDRIDKALMGWFTGEPVDGVRPLRDLREGYAAWTGQAYLDVDVFEFAQAFRSSYDSRKHAALRETLSRASWGEIFADNQYVMMMKNYRDSESYGNWRRFVSDIESVPDFQTRHWTRVGGYGNLATVPELGVYPMLTSPTDEEVSYSLTKRGGLDDVSFEALIDGKSNRMRRVPEAMARAARRTLYTFILNLMTTDNPTMGYDSTALYIAGHGNTGTTALSIAGVDAVTVAMRDQTAYNESLEILGGRNKPKFLIVPAELEGRALRITNPSDGYVYAIAAPADTETVQDPARFKNAGMEVVVNDQFTDATDWYVVGDPAQVNTVIVGFLNGDQEPALFVQDGPTEGSVFTADRITFKVRHIYGAVIADHRSFYRMAVGG